MQKPQTELILQTKVLFYCDFLSPPDSPSARGALQNPTPQNQSSFSLTNPLCLDSSRTHLPLLGSCGKSLLRKV